MPKTGYKQSEETKAKRAATLRAKYADPAWAEQHRQAVAAGIKRWHENPDNAAAFAKRSSERMKKRHTEPDFQERRNARSSRTAKALWENQREHLTALATERYWRMRESGIGICSKESEAKRDEAAKWIMKRAMEAMHTETDYDDTYATVQARVREERPYAADEWPDYIDYCSWCGTQVTNSPECREIADAYLSKAIPRFAADWRAMKG